MKRKTSLLVVLFSSEFRQLAGAKWGNLVFLFGIYFFSLFFIGSSKGVKNYLENKMDDPFVNIVTSKVNSVHCHPWEMKNYFENDPTLKVNYGLSSVDFYEWDFMGFAPTENSSRNDRFKIGVLDDDDHAIWKMIESSFENYQSDPKNNLLFKEGYQQLVIISKEKVERLGIEGQANIFWRERPDSTSLRIELPIAAVLEVMPLQFDMIISRKLFEFLNTADTPVYDQKTYVTKNEWDDIDTSLFSFKKPAPLHTGGYLLKGTTPAALDAMKSMKTLRLLSIPSMISSNTYDSRESYDNMNGICFQFDELKNVRHFSNFLKENPTDCKNSRGVLDIDLNTIESKENLDLFNKFGTFLAVALVLVSIILIVNYSMALLRLHITRNKKNLGTLTAFGFKNNSVTGLYLYISAVLLLITFLAAYLFCLFIGNVALNLVITLAGTHIQTGELAYSSLSIYSAMGLFIALPLVLIYIQIIRLLKLSPGDLVYERNNE